MRMSKSTSVAKAGVVAATALAAFAMNAAPSSAATGTLQRSSCLSNGTQVYFVTWFTGTTCFQGSGDLASPIGLPWKPGTWGAGQNSGWFTYNDANGVEQRVNFSAGQTGNGPNAYIKHLHVN
ncbi:hypothetical protein [Streptomyces sp. NPDC050504]|uniref:hypothetical protein n=1 Tax=Streptomyces sp. NPDC050504 TaxID=3365618 RepID=UPI0037A7A3E9